MQSPKILSGNGCLSQMKNHLHGPVVVISDQGLASAGVAQKVAALLGAEECFTFLCGEPTTADVDRAAALLRDRPATVVGLGGGSALDLAKLAASVALGEASADAYGECLTPLPGKLKTVLIPTTAGTGSEMTRTAVFTNSLGRKTWAWGEELQAEVAVLDPDLTCGLPLAPTIFTAVDALSHALEASTGKAADKLTLQLARQAVEIIPRALKKVMLDLSDLEAREDLLNASGLAGIVLNSGGTGLAHALAHALGTLVKVPHGLAIAWALRTTVEWNGADCYRPFPWLAPEPAKILCGWLDSLPLAALPDFDPQELARAMRYPENRIILDNNPRPVTDEDIPHLCEAFKKARL